MTFEKRLIGLDANVNTVTTADVINDGFVRFALIAAKAATANVVA